MVANKTTAGVVGACLVLVSASCSGEASVAKIIEVAYYLQDNLAGAVAAFEKKVDECHQQAQGNVVPKLDKIELQRINASHEDLVVAMGRLYKIGKVPLPWWWVSLRTDGGGVGVRLGGFRGLSPRRSTFRLAS